MSDKIAKHQFFDFRPGRPYLLFPIIGNQTDLSTLRNHWHDELEIAYVISGRSSHYINGECIIGYPGRLIATNSDFIHSIVPDEDSRNRDEIVDIVLILHPDFLRECLPEYSTFYFTNEKRTASPEVKAVCEKLLDWSSRQDEPFADVCIRGLILELLYWMTREGTVPREYAIDSRTARSIERMKEVVTYIENNYADHLTQAMVAEKFYFSPEYFSRYFKKCTGNTFTDYLMLYRSEEARKDLLFSDISISELALRHGFSDERRFIISFKKIFHETPLQYRKKHSNMWQS